MSKVGGLLSSLKLVGLFITRMFGELTFKFELFDEVFSKPSNEDKDKDKDSNISNVKYVSNVNAVNTENTYKENTDINRESNRERNSERESNNIKNISISEETHKSLNLVSLINESNTYSDRSFASNSSSKKKKNEIKPINCCCFHKDRDKIKAMNSYFDKTFDVRNYFKRMIDIEKIKTILSSKKETDKEFLLKKFNRNELEEFNFNIYERKLLLNYYLNYYCQDIH